MIIITARLPKAKFAYGVAFATLATTALFVFSLVRPPYQEVWNSSANPQVAYLESYGWEVGEMPLTTQDLRIPQQLDASYEAYILLQTEQGFPSLLDYQGEEVQQYTYEILNYPTGEEGVWVNLLYHKGEVIGGEVLSPQLNGFLHGLEMP